MIPLVLLKILGDIGFYYSFAGFFAVCFGASANMLIVAAMIQAAAFTLSYLLREKGALRFLPPAAALLVLALPGICIPYVLAVLPPAAYVFMSSRDKTYCPVWAVSADLISLYSKIIFLFSVISVVLGGGNILLAVTVPFAIITMFSTVMLTRSLRHDVDVYTSPLYQAMNAGTAAVIALATLAVSSEGFRNAAGSLLRTVYLKTIMPVLLFLTQFMVYAFVGVVNAVKWLLALLRIEGEEATLENAGGDAADMEFFDTEYDPNAHPIVKLIAVILVIAAACCVAYRLFKRFSGSRQREIAENTGEIETRSFGFSQKLRSGETSDSSVEKIRAQYRHYLKIYQKRNLPLDRSFTSEDIMTASEKAFDGDANRGLRELYIKARYAEKASKEDAEAAKEYVKTIRKSSDA